MKTNFLEQFSVKFIHIVINTEYFTEQMTMRVYYKTSGVEHFSEEFARPLNELADILLWNMLERVKYKIMWSLRSIENEINDSDGIILIECEDWTKPIKITGRDFTDELGEKINALAKGVQL